MNLCLRKTIFGIAALAFFPGVSPLAHADLLTTGLLYVADYGKSELDRYQYTFDQTTGAITGMTPDGIGGSTTNAYFLGGSSNPIKEGLQGTSDDLIVVVGAHGNTATTLERYSLDGTYIGTVPVDFSVYNNGNVGIGNVAITADGRYEYAPLETANEIVKIDLVTGAIVDSYAFTGAHDVAIAPNGDIYASDYASGSPKIIRLTSNLTFIQNLVTAAPNGVANWRPSGLSVAADGSLYVDDNTSGGGDDSVLHYTFTNNGGVLTANYDSTKSYIGSSTNNRLEFTFGNNIGPDGNLYIAALGGGGNVFSTRSGYVDGVYEFNTSTDSVSQFITGYTEKSGPSGPSGLEAPKYLQFDTNFVKAPDAGLVPEPGTTALMFAGLGALGLFHRLRRKV